MPALMIAVIFPATNDQSKITRITVARGSSHEANHCAGRYGDVRDRRLCGHRIGDSQCRLTEVFIDPPPRGLDWCAHDATVCRPGSGPRLRSNRSTPLKALASCRKRRCTTGSDMARYAANKSAASRPMNGSVCPPLAGGAAGVDVSGTSSKKNATGTPSTLPKS